jgi:hypothetical protein
MLAVPLAKSAPLNVIDATFSITTDRLPILSGYPANCVPEDEKGSKAVTNQSIPLSVNAVLLCNPERNEAATLARLAVVEEEVVLAIPIWI